MSRPSLSPDAMAAITERAPARLVRKLDDQPRLAEAWTWSATSEGLAVETDTGERVTLPVREGHVDGDLACSCLLAPRCLHVLAVARALPLGLARAPAGPSAQPDREPDAQPSTIDRVELTAAQREAAHRLATAAAELLDAGALAAGAATQAALLRAVHGARAQGLHRAAAAGLRVVTRVRELESEAPTFALAALARDLDEVLGLGLALSERESAGEADLGTARRRYADIGQLRLHGLLAEPVVTASGYAGVASWLLDERGRLFTISDVAPGEVERAAATYGGGLRLGELSLSHRELARSGLFLQHATASRDGRLGAGAGVQAARAPRTAWDTAPIVTRFAEPLEAQLERAYAGEGPDLLFLEVAVGGLARDGLVLVHGSGRTLLAVARPDRAELPARETLRLLARAPGLALRLIARPIAPHRVAAVALSPLDASSLVLPSSLGDRVCVGLDPLPASALVAAAPRAVEAPFEPRTPDPLASLRRRIERAVLAGRASLPPTAADEVEREAAALERGLMPTAAALHRGLLHGALARPRSRTGARAQGEAAPFGRAWLALALYARAAQRAIERRAWGA